MTISEAYNIQSDFWRKNGDYTDDELFLFTEASHLLIEETGEPEFMFDLGAVYYERKEYDLALKYYEMAADHNYHPANLGLGYIWYYGRVGEPDYKKAFECYKKAGEQGSIVAEYKLADMYKNGYYVEKDYRRYKDIIEKLYDKVENAQYLDEAKPEIFTRLAAIRAEEGRKAEAAELYLVAEDFLAQRIKYNPFFGNLTIMKYLIDNLYKLLDFDWYDISFYDLYYVLQAPSVVTLTFMDDGGNEMTGKLSSVCDDSSIAVEFNGKWFRTIDDFFAKAELGGHRLTEIYDRIYILEAGSN